MLYTNKSFTLPANTSKISQKEWDRIFGKEENGKDNTQRIRGESERRSKSV